MNQYISSIVFHPAVTLREKFEKIILAVLNEESTITQEMAVLFEKVTKISASFWINKQARYNEYVARK